VGTITAILLYTCDHRLDRWDLDLVIDGMQLLIGLLDPVSTMRATLRGRPMFSKYSKRARCTLTALAVAVLVLVGWLMASPPFMAADSHAQKKHTVRAVISSVDTQAGLVVLWLPVGPEVQALQRGDSIALMVEGVAEETEGTPQ